jgi:Tol biopolymer transport system component
MASPFDITVPSNTVNLDNKREGVMTFTVHNNTRRRLRAVAQLTTQPPEAAKWLALLPPEGDGVPGGNIRDFPIDSTQQYQVKIAVPMDAPPGSVTVELIVADEVNPDENFTESPQVMFTVRAIELPPPRPPLPVWLIAAIIIGVLVIVGLILVVINNRPVDVPTPTPSQIVQLPTPIGGGHGQIAFESIRDGSNDIYVVDVETNAAQRLTNSPAADYSPSWSADGSRIAFQSDRDGNFEIYSMDADGSNLRRLTIEPGNDAYPSWSPDGTQIAFQSDRDGTNQIYVMSADGSNVRRLTIAPPGDKQFPLWSPDGSQLVFTYGGQIYVMNSDGSNVRLLYFAGEFAAAFAGGWSPDGLQIVFSIDVGGASEIFVMNADGSNSHALTNNQTDNASPVWSPDGSQIAFQSFMNGNFEIHIMNSDGSNVRRLTNDPAVDTNPAWRP